MAKKTKMLCPACRTKNESEEKICRRCGLPLTSVIQDVTERKITCPRCRSTNDAASFFCYTCGKYFADVAPIKAGRIKHGTSRSSVPKARVVMPDGTEITLTGEPVFIERSDFNGSIAQDILMKVSRQHILITYDRGKYYVKDYGRDGKGSTNHTRVNGTDIHGKTRKSLKDGDKIELAGQAELTLTFKSLKVSK
jgi:DNA-directed RNA polymerase subunit RPC12/RpoP